MYDKADLMDLGGKCDGVALKQTVSYSSDPKLAINGSLKGGDGKVTNTNPSYAKITSLETTLLLHLQSQVRIKTVAYW